MKRFSWMTSVSAVQILASMILLSSCSGALEADHLLSEKERTELALRADLILQGEIAPMPHGRAPDAIEAFPDVSFAAAFKVVDVYKGSWQKPVIILLVHSPSMTFGQLPEYGKAALKQFYFYFKKSESGKYLLIGTEWKYNLNSGQNFRYIHESDAEQKATAG